MQTDDCFTFIFASTQNFVQIPWQILLVLSCCSTHEVVDGCSQFIILYVVEDAHIQFVDVVVRSPVVVYGCAYATFPQLCAFSIGCVACQIVVVSELIFVEYELDIGAVANLLDELCYAGRFFFRRFIDVTVNQVSFDVAVVFQFTTVSGTRIFVRLFSACPSVILRIEYDRVHVEYAFSLTVSPVSTLVREGLCRSFNGLLEGLFDVSVQTCRVNVFYIDFISRSILAVVYSQLAYSFRIHCPYQVVRSVVFSIRQHSEYQIHVVQDFFSTVYFYSVCSFFPVNRICRISQSREVDSLTVFSQSLDFHLFVNRMELSLADALVAVELNLVIDVFVHLLREELLPHIVATDIIRT